MVITRSKARSRQTLDCVNFHRANLPGSASTSKHNICQQPSYEWGVSSSTQAPGGCLTTSLGVRNERHHTVCKCRVDCLSCPDLSRSLEVKSNIAEEIYRTINIKSHESHCKIRNYIYLFNCGNCDIKYVGESITPVNFGMNIH